MPKPIEKAFFVHCPRSRRIIGVNLKSRIARILLPVTGLLALGWVLFRVLPKPSRITYPCVQAALKTAEGSLGWAALVAGGLWSGFAAQKLGRRRPILAALMALLMAACLIPGINGLMAETASAQASTGIFIPSDPPNQPMGTARGIFPGRVVWAHDEDAVSYDGKSKPWWDPKWYDQDAINKMADEGMTTLAGAANVTEAWDKLFHDFNQKHGRGAAGYAKGEKIVMKVNINNWADGSEMDAIPQSVYAILRQLIEAGVAGEDINVYDASRNRAAYIKNYCGKDFPTVRFNDNGKWVKGQITYSSEITAEGSRTLPEAVVNADYMINMCLLKRHSLVDDKGRSNSDGGVTLSAKNNFGSLQDIPPLHESIMDWHADQGMGNYNPFVDLTGSSKLGGNTVLFMIDALFMGNTYNSRPLKLSNPFFNGKWPCSYFFSQDPVALDSVGLDLLRSEMPFTANADNYLHEEALADNPPSGIVYKPDGVRLSSLGVHEHWNDPVNRQYSRNLGTGDGIELVMAGPAQTPSPSPAQTAIAPSPPATVAPAPAVSPAVPTVNTGDAPGLGVWAILGIAIGGAGILTLILVLVIRRGKKLKS